MCNVCSCMYDCMCGCGHVWVCTPPSHCTRQQAVPTILQCPLQWGADCTDMPIAMHTAMHSTTATHHVPTHDAHCDELIASCHKYVICWQFSMMCQLRCMIAIASELQRCVRCSMCYVASACCSQSDALVIVYVLVDTQHLVICNFECIFGISAQQHNIEHESRCPYRASYGNFRSKFTTVSWFAPPSPGGPTLRPFF